MKICHITQNPVAYMPARFVDLINKYTPHKACLVQVRDFFIGNPLSVLTSNKTSHIIECLETSDVLHFHNCNIFTTQKIRGIDISKYIRSKKICLHYHGSPQRESPHNYQNSVPTLLSTPEMIPLFPKGVFFPNLIDPSDNGLYPPISATPKDGKLKVCHLYSMHPNKKDTDCFVSAQGRVNGCVELHLLQKKTIDASLRERAAYHVVVDHFQGYYGLISIEGMAQGQAVINGASDATMDALDRFLGYRPPFMRCTRDNFLEKIRGMGVNEAMSIGESGRVFVNKYWHGKDLIQRMIDFYLEL